jgi:hypothetical protein
MGTNQYEPEGESVTSSMDFGDIYLHRLIPLSFGAFKARNLGISGANYRSRA